MRIKGIIALVIVFIFIGCQNSEFHTPNSYMKWLNNSNKLSDQQVQNGISVKFTFQPIELRVLRSFLNPNDFDKDVFNDKRQELLNDSSSQFILEISRQDGIPILDAQQSHRPEYFNLLEYLNGGIIHDIELLIDGDTILPAFVQLERTYGLDPTTKLLIVFGTNVSNRKVQLIYNDRIYNIGLLRYNLDLINLPTLTV